MSGLVNGASDAYKATQEVKRAVDTYNKYCQDWNNSRSYNDDAKTALAGLRLIEAIGVLDKLKVPLSGDPARLIDEVAKLRDERQLDRLGITDPEVRRLLELEPRKPIDNNTCPALDYPVPPAPVSKDFIDEIEDAVKTHGTGLKTGSCAATPSPST